ncbi:MAG: endonuclease/exonuclease/phosphatase family protein [Bacteroidota bacterium]
MKKLKYLLWGLLIVLIAGLLYVGSIIGYAMNHDFDPPPEMVLDLQGNGAATDWNDTLNLVIWNIGYGGLGEECDFFYDQGKSVWAGSSIVRTPLPLVEKNLRGVYHYLDEIADSTDFLLLQEVDRASARSQGIDQYAQLNERLTGFQASFAKNYDVPFVPIPLFQPMGKVVAGLGTWSKWSATEAIRFSFEGNYDWPSYLFFLDRCFVVNRYDIPGEQDLVIINTHNSAYDDGSLKQRQMEQLQGLLLEEYEKGNFVIVGGDWNQYPPDFGGWKGFEVEKSPENTNLFVSESYPSPGWRWIYDPAVASNRLLTEPFNPDSTERLILDFYLLSPNVQSLSVQTVEMDFGFSDHHPVYLKVALRRPIVEEDQPMEILPLP